MWNKEWKTGIDYPKWGNTEVYKKTIGGGYLYNGENPKQAYERVCKTVARRLGRPDVFKKSFSHFWTS
jgi:hypothetical protein